MALIDLAQDVKTSSRADNPNADPTEVLDYEYKNTLYGSMDLRKRQRILSAHAAYAEQARQLHEQMKSQLQSEMPNPHPSTRDHMMTAAMQTELRDPGWILLRALPPYEHSMMGMGDHGAIGPPH